MLEGKAKADVTSHLCRMLGKQRIVLETGDEGSIKQLSRFSQGNKTLVTMQWVRESFTL